MGALRPYILLAVAVAIGAALAPVVGPLLLIGLLLGAAVFGFLVLRPMLPMIASFASFAVVGWSVWALIFKRQGDVSFGIAFWFLLLGAAGIMKARWERIGEASRITAD